MENPLRYETFKSDNPSVSSMYNKNAKKLCESMDFKKGDIIMDYGSISGCGSGQFISEYLFPEIDHPKFICGVDSSPQLVKFVYENLKNKGEQENLIFSIGDIMDKYGWTFKENMVNKFVAYLVLCYVQDYRLFINKVYDFLKPGGQVGMLVPFSKAYGIPQELLSREKWIQYSEKNELVTRSSFASWTYSDEIDAPLAIKESLVSSGFRIDEFSVEEMNLDFPSLTNLCEFLCVLTSVMSSIPEELENEFIEEMVQLVQHNLSRNGVKVKGGVIYVDWKLLNFVATKM